MLAVALPVPGPDFLADGEPTLVDACPVTQRCPPPVPFKEPRVYVAEECWLGVVADCPACGAWGSRDRCRMCAGTGEIKPTCACGRDIAAGEVFRVVFDDVERTAFCVGWCCDDQYGRGDQ